MRQEPVNRLSEKNTSYLNLSRRNKKNIPKKTGITAGHSKPLISHAPNHITNRRDHVAAELEIIDRSEEWAAFLKKKYKTELNKLTREYPHTKSLTIGYDILEGYGKTGIILADELLERPGKPSKTSATPSEPHTSSAAKTVRETIPRKMLSTASTSGSSTSRGKPRYATSAPNTLTNSSALTASSAVSPR